MQVCTTFLMFANYFGWILKFIHPLISFRSHTIRICSLFFSPYKSVTSGWEILATSVSLNLSSIHLIFVYSACIAPIYSNKNKFDRNIVGNQYIHPINNIRSFTFIHSLCPLLSTWWRMRGKNENAMIVNCFCCCSFCSLIHVSFHMAPLNKQKSNAEAAYKHSVRSEYNAMKIGLCNLCFCLWLCFHSFVEVFFLMFIRFNNSNCANRDEQNE